MKITEFQLKIIAGYVLSYLRWTKKLESERNTKYEIEAEKTISCVADMLSLIRGENINVFDAFDSINISTSDSEILKQVKDTIENLN